MNIKLLVVLNERNTMLGRLLSIMLIPVLTIGSPLLIAATESTSQLDTKANISVALDGQIKANRTLPEYTKIKVGFSLPTNPSDRDIFEHSLFEEPLVPIGGKTTEQENRSLALALVTFSKRTSRDDFSSLERFLSANPSSAWRISLLTDLGWSYRQTGWYSKALKAWEQAWIAGQKTENTGIKEKATIDRALAELIVLNARIGRMTELAALIQLADARSFVGSSKEKLEAAKQALQLMRTRPATSFRCGPMAVEKLRNIVDKNDPGKLKVMSLDSTARGTNMSQLRALAKKLGLNEQVARREAGSSVLVPAVVNWKVGHFAALTERKGQLFRLHDPTFGYDVWISEAALDSEASGYFLVKSGALPTGWTEVSDVDAASVWGKGTNDGGDPNGNGGPTPKCGCPNTQGSGGPGSPASSGNSPSSSSSPGSSGGMARCSIYEMLASLSVEDTPLFYSPPYGPSVLFTITYSQRESNQPSTFGYSNLGPLWTFSWLSYITDDQDNPGADITQYLSGGGTLSYTGYNTGTHSYAPQLQTACIVKLINSSTYELDEPDGSKQIFSAATTASPRKIFLTETIDPQGNALTFTYDTFFRLVAVTDALGQVSTLSYGSADMYKITQVTDPFGRTATLTYTSAGTLQTSTDMSGIVSSYAYNNNGMTSLITPYGTTTFDLGQNENDRWVQINDPQGGQERLETWNNYNTNVPASADTYPSGYDNYYLNLRNSFYWDKKAMMDAPGNYNMAYITHWLHEPDYSTMSGQVESEKSPLESRVYFGYPNQPANIVTGSSGTPSAQARILDDGTTQQYQSSYSPTGRLLQSVDPEGRTTNYTYATNNIDLVEVSQQNNTDQEIVLSATYNSQHEPLSITDGGGNTTEYTYNAQGQPTTTTDATGAETSFTYTGGYLTTISWAQTGASSTFSYDSFGRPLTATDMDGYSITMSYDSLDRLIQVAYPDGTTDQTTYSKLDIAKTKDRQGRWTQYLYNQLQQLVGVIDPAGRVTTYKYCTCGELLSLTDMAGNRTSWTNDIEGRLTTKSFTDGSQITYTYDGVGRAATITDAKDQITTYTYNSDDTISNIAYSNSTVSTPPVSYTYDSVYGRVSTMTDGTGTTSYSYNPVNGSAGAGQLASEVGPLGSTAEIDYTYDQLGRITGIVVGDTSSTITYDSLGRVVTANNSLGAFTYNYSGASGRPESLTYPSGQKTTYSYLDSNHNIWLGEIKNQTSANSLISQNDYTYNPVGSIATWQQQRAGSDAVTWNYSYDSVDQLLQGDQLDTTSGSLIKQLVFRYDSDGNRVASQIGVSLHQDTINDLNQVVSTSGTGSLTFSGTLNKAGTVSVAGNPASIDGSNHFRGLANVTAGTNVIAVVAANINGYSATNNYQVVVPPHTETSLSYDLNGNLTDNGRGQTYGWDAKDELVSITYSDGTSSHFGYDGLGRRVLIQEESASGGAVSTKQLLWVGDTLDQERDSANTVQKRFFAQGEQIGGTNYYFTKDHLGSIREVTDGSGAVQASYDYDPFGRAIKVSGTIDSDFQFAGYYEHAPSQLNLVLFRAYDPQTAKWLSRDPLAESAGPNIYEYCLNDPIDELDPFGLLTIIIPGVGPQRDSGGNSSNEDFIRDVSRLDPDSQVVSRDHLNDALNAINNARANGDNTLNIDGYSRGGYAAIQLAMLLNKAGISVDNLTTVDPVRVPGDDLPNPLPVPCNVKKATNYYHDGPQKGPTDFPGTPLAPGPNVNNVKITPANSRGYTVHHANMPTIVFGP